jgi:hypothetical protein
MTPIPERDQLLELTIEDRSRDLTKEKFETTQLGMFSPIPTHTCPLISNFIAYPIVSLCSGILVLADEQKTLIFMISMIV